MRQKIPGEVFGSYLFIDVSDRIFCQSHCNLIKYDTKRCLKIIFLQNPIRKVFKIHSERSCWT
jgi:hypothetical protein